MAGWDEIFLTGWKILMSDTAEGTDDATDNSEELKRRIEKLFDEHEKQRLALFSLFYKVVDLEVLFYMGVREFVSLDEPRGPWALSELSGDEREAWTALAGRAEAAGIISSAGESLWFIEAPVARVLHQYTILLSTDEARLTRAFVESLAIRADMHHRMAEISSASVRRQIALHEPNYLAALSIAATEGWASCIANLLEALQRLYNEPNRISDWRNVVNLATPVFTDNSTGAALPGREQYWPIITSFRVQLLIRER